jgi:ribonuclease P protein component
MRSARDFALAIRSGSRTRQGPLVVHQYVPAAPDSARPALVGFVVGRAVGNSVVRHRVVRRLRAVTTPHLEGLPRSSRTVVRALPDCAASDSSELAGAITAALQRLRRRSAGSRGSA